MGEAAAKRDDEGGEARIAPEAPGDEVDEAFQDDGKPSREVGGVGLDRGWEGRGAHEHIHSTGLPSYARGLTAERNGVEAGAGGCASLTRRRRQTRATRMAPPTPDGRRRSRMTLDGSDR